jgi:uncharacterized protein YecT (DUF1311 family)
MARRLLLTCCALALLAAAAISPASAIDCSRAAGAVETAICGDDGLRRADARFNRDYSTLLGRLDAQQRRELIESQKLWLTGRNALCMAKPSVEVADCVGTAMTWRKDELAREFSDGHVFGRVSLGKAGQTLMVGHQRLDVTGQSGELLRLVQGGTVFAESIAPFQIDGRGGDDKSEAVVVSTHDYGNLGLSEQAVLWSLPDQPLHVEALKAGCSDYEVARKGRRLELRTRVSPGCDGVVRTWSAEGGLGPARSIVFSPRRGTTMADFHQGDSPTDIEQFYLSLKRLAPRDWRPLALALSFATVRTTRDDTGKYIVLSPCSTDRSCQVVNAFAAYAKAGKRFFFARDVLGSGVTYFPDRAAWPADLTPIVDEWVGGAMRD